MIPSSVKDIKGTFCRRDLEESCDFAFASTVDDCFDRIELSNGTKLMEKIKKCEEERAKASEIAQRNNGIIAVCSVLVLLFCCFLLTWKLIVPKIQKMLPEQTYIKLENEPFVNPNSV